jgi:translation initiation factor eIF-2B subunit beta
LKLIREVSVRIIHGKNEGSDISLTLQAVLNDRTTTSTINEDDNENSEENLRPKKHPIPTNITEAIPINNLEGDVSVQRLKPELMDDLNWYSSEIELSVKNLSQQALAHIHANEIILTLGYSYTVEQFFKYAASKKRQFHVFILEHAPFFTGHKMAINLSQSNIPVTVVTDSAVFAIMARVNKIVIGTRSLLANGGLTAKSGTYNLALAAKNYNVPLLVCAASYKFSPTYLPSFDPVMCNSFPSPEKILSYESIFQSSLDIVVPMHDYVPPELVTLIIGSGMGNAPSYVYRIVSELYSAEDNDLERSQKKSLA